jgi:MoxR-like ATPase
VTERPTDPALPSPAEARERLEQALFEIRRVIAGQDAMLERVLVCLLAQGHLLLEGVPGLAKTLTIKTAAGVLGGSFARVQFTPDLVPSDLVGTRVYRAGEGTFDTELGPVFCNFLLADEINRAPAKVQSALLEVMQERQVTIGHTTYPVPSPFLALATQNPIESEGTYPLPEAQLDRFMLKVLIGYPEHDEELTIVHRQLVAAPELREALSLEELKALQRAVFDLYVDPRARLVCGRRRDRHPDAARARARRHGRLRRLRRLAAWADQPDPGGACARAAPRSRLRARRGRERTREGRAPPPARAHVSGARGGGEPRHDPRRRAGGGPEAAARPLEADRGRMSSLAGLLRREPTPERPGPGPMPTALLRALDVRIGRRIDGLLAGDFRATVLGDGSELAQIRPYVPGDDVRRIDWNVTARTTEPHVRVPLAERVLVTWLVLDTSPSMQFGTADRRKADVAEGVALAIGHLATRRGNRLGVLAFGGGETVALPPRQGRVGLIGLLSALREEGDADRDASLGAAIKRAGALARQRALVVVVSDFRGPRDWRKPLLELAGRHDVVAVEIRDPREEQLPNAGQLWLVDPETGRQLRVDTRSARLRARFAAAAAAERGEVRRALAALGVRHVVLSTEGDWLRRLAVFLRRRQR